MGGELRSPARNARCNLSSVSQPKGPRSRSLTEGFVTGESPTPLFVGSPVKPAENPPTLRPGLRIGPYRIERELGHGGMGAVYLAMRADEAFEKRVAIKVIRGALGTPEAVLRFRRERQILARLEHPNIARLLDGGTTEEGLPYFVMEYIEGRPLHAHCDEKRLATAARLALFLEVCCGRGVRPPEPRRPSRPEARQHPGHRGRACPSSSTSASPSSSTPRRVRRPRRATALAFTPGTRARSRSRASRSPPPPTSIRWGCCSTSC